VMWLIEIANADIDVMCAVSPYPFQFKSHFLSLFILCLLDFKDSIRLCDSYETK
jgi:hypothetical protein